MLIFTTNVEFVKIIPCPSGSSINGRFNESRASECWMSGLEKSTPVSTIAITISVPVALYSCFTTVEPVILPILEASSMILSDEWKSNLESSITV